MDAAYYYIYIFSFRERERVPLMPHPFLKGDVAEILSRWYCINVQFPRNFFFLFCSSVAKTCRRLIIYNANWLSINSHRSFMSRKGLSKKKKTIANRILSTVANKWKIESRVTHNVIWCICGMPRWQKSLLHIRIYECGSGEQRNPPKNFTKECLSAKCHKSVRTSRSWPLDLLPISTRKIWLMRSWLSKISSISREWGFFYFLFTSSLPLVTHTHTDW